MTRKAALCIMFASFILLTEGNNVTLLPDGVADVISGNPLSLQCVYTGTNNASTFNFYLNPDTRGVRIRISSCMIVSAVGYNTSLYNQSCGTNNVSLIILAVSQEHDGQKWECDVSFTAVVPIPPKASTIIRVTAATTPATTPTTTSSTSHTPNMTSAGTPETTEKPKCVLELGLGLGLGLGIPCVITVIVVVIFICTGYKNAYYLGLVLGLGLGITFQVGWIIIASLISTGNECKLELGLGLGLGSGMPDVIAYIVSVIFVFFMLSLFIDIPNRVELGKSILTGLLSATVIGIIVVYIIYDKLKPEQTDKKTEEAQLERMNKKSKTKNSGPPTVHTRTQNKVEPNTNSKKTNDRQQPVPPANTGFEDTPTFRRLPQPPQNGEIKDRSLRGISATIDDTPDLASETPRSNRLRPLTPKQATVQKEDASEEPKKKRKKKRKKDQMNVENPEEENGETDLRVN